MIQLYKGGAYLIHGTDIVPEQEAVKVEQLTGKKPNRDEARKGTIAYSILKAHNTSDTMEHLKIKRSENLRNMMNGYYPYDWKHKLFWEDFLWIIKINISNYQMS